MQVRAEAASGVTDAPDDRLYVDLLADTHGDAREVPVPARQSIPVIQPYGKATAKVPTRHENGARRSRSDGITRAAVDVEAFVEAVPRQALAEELGDRTAQRPRPDRGSLRRYRPRPDRDLQVRAVCDGRSRKTPRQHGDPGEGALGDGDRTRSGGGGQGSRERQETDDQDEDDCTCRKRNAPCGCASQDGDVSLPKRSFHTGNGWTGAGSVQDKKLRRVR